MSLYDNGMVWHGTAVEVTEVAQTQTFFSTFEKRKAIPLPCSSSQPNRQPIWIELRVYTFLQSLVVVIVRRISLRRENKQILVLVEFLADTSYGCLLAFQMYSKSKVTTESKVQAGLHNHPKGEKKYTVFAFCSFPCP